MIVLVVLFVAVPLVELYVLAQVSHAIGLGPALAVLLAVSVLGAALVKRQGLAVLRNVRRELNDRQLPAQHLAEGALVMLSGALLVVPGFVTDAVGAVLLVPPVRRRVATYLRARHARRSGRRGRPITATYGGRIVVDTTEAGSSHDRLVEVRQLAGRDPGGQDPGGQDLGGRDPGTP